MPNSQTFLYQSYKKIDNIFFKFYHSLWTTGFVQVMENLESHGI